MANETTGDVAALARLAERLTGAKLIGFGQEGERVSTAKVGNTKNPDDQIPK
jgi:hypothetical protein